MNYRLLSSMIQSGIGGTKTPATRSHGGSTRSVERRQSAYTIVPIGRRPGRHHLRLNSILKELNDDSVAVLQYEGNYCQYDWAAISANPDGEHLPRTSFGSFRDTYAHALERLQAAGIRSLRRGFITNFYLDPAKHGQWIETGDCHIECMANTLLPQRYFDHISRGLNRTAILQWLGGDVCNLNHWQEQYNEEITSLAAQYSLPLIDINPLFLNRHYLEECYTADGMHPNATGQAVINEIVANWVANRQK